MFVSSFHVCCFISSFPLLQRGISKAVSGTVKNNLAIMEHFK